MSTPPRATLIFNPLAGPAQMGSAVSAVADFWREQGWRLTIQPTAYAGHATELAREAAAAGHEMVLAAGGDGTLGEVASGLAESETILAPLPAGTANSLANELRLKGPSLWNRFSLLPAARQLAQGRVQRMDLGFCEKGHYWLLWTGAGLDSFLVDAIEPRTKRMRRLGKGGYAARCLWLAWGFSGMRASVEVDGQRFDDQFLMVTVNNSRLYAGHLHLSPTAALDDGQFEILMFHGRSVFRAFRYLGEIITGRHLSDSKGVTVVRGRHVRIETDPQLPYHRDGDPGGQTPFQIEVRTGALRLLVPPTAPPGLFEKSGEPLPAGGRS